MPAQSLQARYFPTLPCFGCGPVNEKGLRLESFEAEGGDVVAEFMPWPEHDNGLGFLNGGIIATLLDCHSAAAVVHEAFARGWGPLPGAALSHVTSGLDVRYLRPTPLRERVHLVGSIVTSTEPEIVARVRVEHDGKVRAEATATWRRWRPRT